MKIVYLIQTYKNPSQIKRLVETIKKSQPDSEVLISHDINYRTILNKRDFEHFSGVNLVYNLGGRGDFSTDQSYLNSLGWLVENQVNFDWVVNLSGQDYPTHPLLLFEQFLSRTKYDGFLEYRNVLAPDGYYGIKESVDRYFYQYWHSGIKLSNLQRALVKPIRQFVNNSQPFLRIGTVYQLSLGIRDYKQFNDKFKCYGGSFFKILSYKCAKYVYRMARERVDLVEFYKKTIVPEESFVQTILANNELFNLCDKNYFYIDWTGTKNGHPNIITVKDYSAMTTGEDYYFARKFDPKIDSEVLDKLDQHIFEKGKLEQD